MVLIISGSFLGLFGMQADYYRDLELSDLANAVTDLVTDMDLLTCEGTLEVNWTATAVSHGLPRTFHGAAYMIQFTNERPYVLCDGTRAGGRYFPSAVVLLDPRGEPVDLLEVPSTTGFVVHAMPEWADWGLQYIILVEALS